ncbi:GH32 C-terminal domain-containing protein [Arthrobacter sp. ISL-5]|uniref:GH32 C-terminal domain-containing protein n=1 Tax=Arthrobacter sp. ISL-5 TaxID=2819111 RepID=UPI001BEA9CFE|nr:GH32 C-terminal domain-containing protein [Arthrobacter sp. ISL-5]MBT2553181.1 GH32 C-terminal domain-containing protein [Arthrobacter sp. ISL-5]
MLVDRSALETFANGRPLTARAYPTLGGGRVRVSADANVRLHQLDAWRMDAIFNTSRNLFPG